VTPDFDRVIPREGTASLKWDGRAAKFGSADVLPLWVADLDFPAPEAVTQALRQRAAHPIYGYTRYPEGLLEALLDWLRRRHGWEVQRDWVLWAPGVVPSLHAAALAFAGPGEGVIVQPPVYPPFRTAVTATGRRLLENPLRLEGSGYRMDLDGLEGLATQGARLLLLCSPHNPVGRVWTRGELEELLELARRCGLVVLSDEIHHDLVYPGRRHLPLGSLAGDAAVVVTALAPSKTFNCPGLGLSALVVPDPGHRAALRQAFGLLHVSAANPFSIAAAEAAYRHGAPWLDALTAYLDASRAFVLDFIEREIPGIRVVPPEGTYLLWLDCRGLGLDDAALAQLLVHRAQVGLSPGKDFGSGGSGFMRLNLGAPRTLIREALGRIAVTFAGGG
jgi:cysteine-S-conjugate beta-lyase